MPTIFPTIDEHIELLQAKGYLEPNFMTSSQVGYWLQEFKEQFDLCYQQAQLEQQPRRFMQDLWGKFNGYLETVHYLLRYKYDPHNDLLSLTSLHTSLNNVRKTYYFGGQDELPAAGDIHERLSKAMAFKNHKPVFDRLAYEFKRDRDTGNDYQEKDPAEKTHKLDLTDWPVNRLRLRPK